MDLDSSKKHCSFCGDQGRADLPLVGGLGAFICGTCVDEAASHVATVRNGTHAAPPPWESMSVTEVLSTLWQIAETGHQAEDFLVEWVGLARSRRASWTQIGKALGMPRQAAVERFALVSRA